MRKIFLHPFFSFFVSTAFLKKTYYDTCFVLNIGTETQNYAKAQKESVT